MRQPLMQYLLVNSFHIYLVSLRAFVELRFVFNNETREVECLQSRPFGQDWQPVSEDFYKEACETLHAYHLGALLNPEPRHIQSNNLPAWPYEAIKFASKPGLDLAADAEARWIAVCSGQGWNENSKVIHLEGFIRDKGLFVELAEYAEAAADEENEVQ